MMDFTMLKLEWDNSYSVGIAEFDEEHKLLFDYINGLRDSMIGKKGKETVEKYFELILEYTNTHFFHEEIMMYRMDYPDYEEHKATHDQFLSEVRGMYVRFHAGAADSRLISAEMIAVVTELLQEHVLKVDMAYGAFFNARGVR